MGVLRISSRSAAAKSRASITQDSQRWRWLVVVAVDVVMMVAIVVDSHRKHTGTSQAAKIQKGDT